MTPSYEVIAVRYGVFHSVRSEQFYKYAAYNEPDAEIQMDFFFWVIRGPEETVLVDTGFHPDAVTHRKGRVCLVPPVDALAELGIELEDVSKIVVTHFHYDHIGNVSSFPHAKIFLQQREYDFWLGKHGNKTAVAHSVEQKELEELQTANKEGRIDFLDGDAQVAPGISARLVGGHCPGQQLVIVNGERPLVLASDTLHFYEEMDRDMPFAIFTDLPGMYETYATLRRLRQDEQAVIVAGHDPRVMDMFPAVPGAEGLAVCLSEGTRS